MPDATATTPVGARPTPNTVVVRVTRLLDTNKAKIAAAVPFVLTLVAVLLNFAFTGEFDNAEAKLAALGLVTTLLTGGAVYKAPAAKAEVEQPASSTVGPQSGVI